MANPGMGCFYHPDATVVASCPKCGKFLCKDCAEKYESKLCDKCEAERIAQIEKNKAQKKEDFHKSSKK